LKIGEGGRRRGGERERKDIYEKERMAATVSALLKLQQREG
jgi:hypothetical protein